MKSSAIFIAASLLAFAQNASSNPVTLKFNPPNNSEFVYELVATNSISENGDVRKSSLTEISRIKISECNRADCSASFSFNGKSIPAVFKINKAGEVVDIISNGTPPFLEGKAIGKLTLMLPAYGKSLKIGAQTSEKLHLPEEYKLTKNISDEDLFVKYELTREETIDSRKLAFVKYEKNIAPEPGVTLRVSGEHTIDLETGIIIETRSSLEGGTSSITMKAEGTEILLQKESHGLPFAILTTHSRPDPVSGKPATGRPEFRR